MSKQSTIFLLFILSLLVAPFFVLAQQFNSASYQVINPVMESGNYASSDSDNFILKSVISQISIGTSTATSFKVNAGFLYFPFVTTPVVTATGGQNTQVPLSWTASSGFLGWNVGGYTVGQSTASGGPYSLASVGNVTSSTRTGLSNGTTYYFVIITEDVFGNHIATSSEVSAAPVASASPPPSGGGGGGGGDSQVAVNFSGPAYPLSRVTLLKDGQIAARTVAGPDAKFQISLTDISGGDYLFSVYGEDRNSIRSTPSTFPVVLTSGANTNISAIFLAPTISVDKSEVKRGDNIAIFGQSAAESQISIIVNSEEEHFGRAQSDKNGVYLYNLDTLLLEYGEHSVKSKATVSNEISTFGKSVAFKIGTKSILAPEPLKCPAAGEVNGDCRVNLIDFSIVAFWYKRLSPPRSVDFNGDGRVDLVDFSIMAYY